ncbi:hypothetical protein [Nocardioides marmoriginsengisoli]|uniref:hypothetical protein n=1 Tax=Nocardioides marmoriginsengisoli TaxID=661483 RepID=UPI0016154EDB|nr:hypothetical protein [Nocardioides marmoriginsengisoli]
MTVLIGVGSLLAVVGLLRLRRRSKRALVAGLDRPAIWREPAPGRVGRPKDRRL